MSGMPEYVKNPKDPSIRLKTALIDEIKALRVGVERLTLRSRDARGVTFSAETQRAFRRGAASDEEMLRYQAGAAGEAGTLRLDAVAPGVFRVRFALGGATPDVNSP